MRSSRRLSALALAGALLAPGCDRADPAEAPRAVARDFWDAVRAGRFEEAQDLSTAASDAPLRALAARHELRELALGEVLRNETTALVETTAVLSEEDAPLAFHTHLTRFDPGWKVDLARSQRELTRAALLASVEDVQDALRGSAEALADEIERSALEGSEAVREVLEELEEALRSEGAPAR